MRAIEQYGFHNWPQGGNPWMQFPFPLRSGTILNKLLGAG
ncbi:hypothetical protein Osc7112_5063 [Oscillatoria nigro-viridis PCC 7112]|uniref:Uncharacterized protein n=1 Tax=Phormidium nigroviride PCC 7112 TaxID=179408 RepID=K9VPA5_9CYAN|nr:hypothetical protein Osc7112_5063 [Oscillatoria nigro-viridis PCC 7112]